MKTHSHGHSGEKLSIKTFNQFSLDIKVQSLPLQLVTFTFLSFLNHSAVSLLQLPLQTLIPNTQLLPFSTIELQNLALLNTYELIAALNNLTKIWLTYVHSFISITPDVLLIPHGLMVLLKIKTATSGLIFIYFLGPS